MDYLSRLTDVYLHPFKTARSLKKEKHPAKPAIFFFTTVLISALIYLISSIAYGSDPKTSLEDAVIYMVSVSLVVGIIVLIAQTIFMLLGDKGSYLERFKAMAYVSAIEIAFAITSIIIMYYPSFSLIDYALGVWALLLFVSFMREFSTLPRTKFIIAMVILVTIQIAIYLVSDYFLDTGFVM